MQILKFKSIEEVVDRANSSKLTKHLKIAKVFFSVFDLLNKIKLKGEYGLAASVFTKNIDNAII